MYVCMHVCICTGLHTYKAYLHVCIYTYIIYVHIQQALLLAIWLLAIYGYQYHFLSCLLYEFNIICQTPPHWLLLYPVGLMFRCLTRATLSLTYDFFLRSLSVTKTLRTLRASMPGREYVPEELPILSRGWNPAAWVPSLERQRSEDPTTSQSWDPSPPPAGLRVCLRAFVFGPLWWGTSTGPYLVYGLR